MVNARRTTTWSALFTALAALVVLGAVALGSSGCFRDGFACGVDNDCFEGEVCRSGTCRPPASTAADAGMDASCVPETDAELCAAQEPCQSQLAVTDRCGTARELTCDCDGVCTPDTVADLCQAAGVGCGMHTAFDRCDAQRTVACGTCTDPEICAEGVCTTCATPVCPVAAQCGSVDNVCGDATVCGDACPSSQLCLENRCVNPILAPASLSPGDRFGVTVQVDEELLVIGAPGTDGDLEDVGSIYIYRRLGGGWTLHQVLENPLPTAGDRMGAVLDVRGDLVVTVTPDELITFARREDGLFALAGIAAEQPEIVSLGLTGNSQVLIGTAVANAAGHTLGYATCQPDTGCGGFANGWTARDQIVEYGPLELGAVIDTAGELAVVGAPGDNVNSVDVDRPEGSFYLFAAVPAGRVDDPSDWAGAYPYYTYENFDDFTLDDPTLRSGMSVALHSDGFAVFGAPQASPTFGPFESGEYFIYSVGTSVPFAVRNRYVPPVGLSYAGCGSAVTFTRSDTMFASCVSRFERDDASRPAIADRWSSGRIYRYDYDTELQEWEVDSLPLEPAGLQPFEQFGRALDGTDDYLFVGAPGRDDDSGAVYLFTPTTWDPT